MGMNRSYIRVNNQLTKLWHTHSNHGKPFRESKDRFDSFAGYEYGFMNTIFSCTRLSDPAVLSGRLTTNVLNWCLRERKFPSRWNFCCSRTWHVANWRAPSFVDLRDIARADSLARGWKCQGWNHRDSLLDAGQWSGWFGMASCHSVWAVELDYRELFLYVKVDFCNLFIEPRPLLF